ncbi:MAG: hypothetical protein J0H08_07905, partial [Rhizobiales bacterium]|nr:hypothetical protein [Hyphomicrobiales bacterium]
MATYTNVQLDGVTNPAFDGGDPTNAVTFTGDPPNGVDISNATFTNWDSETDFVVIDGGSQVASLDITGSSESDHITGGDDTDTLVVDVGVTIDLSAAADQSTGDTAVVTGFENVDASGATASVDLTGSDGANVLTGGDGADTIDGGLGGDTLDGGAGNDTITYDAGDVSIDGGDDTDTLVVDVGVTIDLSAASDQSTGDTAVVTGFENVDASGATASVDLTGSDGANVL